MFQRAYIAERFFGVISPSDFSNLAGFIIKQDVTNCPVISEILRFLRMHRSSHKLGVSDFVEFMKEPFGESSENRSVLSGLSFNFSGTGVGKMGWDEDNLFDF